MKRRPSHPQPPSERTEPQPGSVADLEFRSERGKANTSSNRRTARPSHAWTRVAADWLSKPALTWLLGIGLVLLVLGTVFRKPLADWLWPETRALEMRDAAAAALARGHLTAVDGSGARELYEAAIAIDPDRRDARAGLVDVGRAALEQAERAMDSNDFVAARHKLSLARELAVPRDRTEAFAERLREREAGIAGIDRLLERAAIARKSGLLDGRENAALPIYQRILALQPERVEALEGREDTLSDLLQQARETLGKGDVAAANAMIEAAAGYDRGHVDLPEIRSELTRALERLRVRAARYTRRGDLQAAAGAYDALLEVDPADAVALAGRDALAGAHADRARKAAADFRFPQAEASLAEVKKLAPGSELVGDTQRAIAQARRASTRLSQVANPAPRQANRKRVAQLLQQAREAQERGDLLDPPGESAFDRLRAARAIAPNDPDVLKAQRGLAPAAHRCFGRELARNSLRGARRCLDTWEALEGGTQAYMAARNRLARRWLAVGDQRLGAGDISGATAALQQAEGLDRGVDGFEDFRQRIRTAAISGD